MKFATTQYPPKYTTNMNVISRIKWIMASGAGLALMAAPSVHAASYSSNNGLSSKAGRMQAVASELCDTIDGRSRNSAVRALDTAAESLHQTSIQFAQAVRNTRNIAGLRYQINSMDNSLDRIEALARQANVSRTTFAKIGAARSAYRSLESSFNIAARGNNGGYNNGRDHDHNHGYNYGNSNGGGSWGGWNNNGNYGNAPRAGRPW